MCFYSHFTNQFCRFQSHAISMEKHSIYLSFMIIFLTNSVQTNFIEENAFKFYWHSTVATVLNKNCILFWYFSWNFNHLLRSILKNYSYFHKSQTTNWNIDELKYIHITINLKQKQKNTQTYTHESRTTHIFDIFRF